MNFKQEGYEVNSPISWQTQELTKMISMKSFISGGEEKKFSISRP